MEVRVYQKRNKKKFAKLFNEVIQDMYASRFLAKQLATRDIKAQYRQSYLGILWAFITPLTTALVWVFLNSTGTVQLTDTGVPYALYAFSGTLLWSIITESINAPTSNTNTARGIISKINIPKEAIILSGIYKLLFNTGTKLVILVTFLIFFKVGFQWSLLWFPVAILAAILFGTTIGLYITPVAMLYKDIPKMVSVGLSLLMYITPVVYSIPKEGLMKTIMEYNPFTAIILTSRDLFLGMELQFLNYFLWIMFGTIPLFFIGLVFYRISIPIFIERLSA